LGVPLFRSFAQIARKDELPPRKKRVVSRIDDALTQLDEAEQRLTERAEERDAARERLRRRRELRRRLMGDPVRVPALAAAGSALLVGLLSASGGDLSSWPHALALLAITVIFLGPAALAGWLARARGAQIAGSLAVATFGLQLLLTFAVAFLLLGLGPD
jgi:hypothetical protein